MADVPVLWGLSLAGRLSCSQEFAEMIASACVDGCRFALYGGCEVPLGETPTLAAIHVSALPSKQPTLTTYEREAIEAAARIIDAYDAEMDGFPSGAASILRSLLERTK